MKGRKWGREEGREKMVWVKGRVEKIAYRMSGMFDSVTGRQESRMKRLEQISRLYSSIS